MYTCIIKDFHFKPITTWKNSFLYIICSSTVIPVRTVSYITFIEAKHVRQILKYFSHVQGGKILLIVYFNFCSTYLVNLNIQLILRHRFNEPKF